MMKKLITLFALIFAIQFSAAQEADDSTAINNILGVLMESWEEGNGEKFASVFTDKHDFVVWTGYYFPGIDRAANARNHDNIFSTFYKNTRMYAVMDKLDFIEEDVALIHVLAAVSKAGDGMPKDPAVIWTGLLIKKDGEWKIRSFHNADLEIFNEEPGGRKHPFSAAEMYASWYAAVKK